MQHLFELFLKYCPNSSGTFGGQRKKWNEKISNIKLVLRSKGCRTGSTHFIKYTTQSQPHSTHRILYLHLSAPCFCFHQLSLAHSQFVHTYSHIHAGIHVNTPECEIRMYEIYNTIQCEHVSRKSVRNTTDIIHSASILAYCYPEKGACCTRAV